MKTEAAPSKVYSAPTYVSAFRVAGAVCVLLALYAFFVALTSESLSPWTGVGVLIAGLVNFLYADIAEAIARTQWRVDLLAHQLQPVIGEILEQSAVREKAERAAAKAREEEIRRLVTARNQAIPDEKE